MKGYPELTVKVWPSHRGYANVKVNGKWEWLHIYVWELYNGPIPKNSDGKRILEVHHRTKEEGGMGVKCNCICNLKALTSVEHQRTHHVGTHQSEETRQKRSTTLKGVPKTVEHIQHSADARRGKKRLPRSEKTKMKIKESGQRTRSSWSSEYKAEIQKRAWETRRKKGAL